MTTTETIPEEPTTPVEEQPAKSVGTLTKRVSKKFSSYFARRVQDAHGDSSPSRPGGTSVPLSSSIRQNSYSRNRTGSRTSRMAGSAYGYGGGYRNRISSNVTLAGRRGSLASTIARRRQSNIHRNSEVEGAEGSELNFAQRLLMANENAVTNIADLWVAAAMNADNEDVFLSDDEAEFEDEDEDEGPFQDEDEEIQSPTINKAIDPPRLLTVPSDFRTGRLSSSSRRSSNLASPRLSRPQHRPSLGQVVGSLDSPRRSSSSVPAIFSHTGVRTPSGQVPAVPPAQPLLPREPDLETGRGDGLAPIVEGRSRQPSEQQITDEPLLDSPSEKPPSVFSQLPIIIIFQ